MAALQHDVAIAAGPIAACFAGPCAKSSELKSKLWSGVHLAFSKRCIPWVQEARYKA